MSKDAPHQRMTLEQVAPELRARTRMMPSLPVGSPLGRWLLRNALKLFARDKSYEGVRIDQHAIPDGVEVRVYTPENVAVKAGLLWIHGGGLVIGNVRQNDDFCVQTARELGIVVISAEYRLAPDFPFPAALDDCHAAWQWLQAYGDEYQIDRGRIAIGGQSAGGGLAASLVQRLHDEGGIQPIAQWLFCPMLDDRTALREELDVVNHFIWNNRKNRVRWRAYLGAEFGAERVADYAVPARRDDLSGLPPAWIGISDIELFFDESRAYAERLQACGVACTLDVVAGAPHGFEAIPPHTELALDYLARSRAWLKEQLG